MASGLSSPLGVAGIIFIIIGIIMAVIGIILLIANQNQPKQWYIWLLLIGGVVLGIIGGIMLAVALSTAYETPCAVPCAEPQPKIQYVQPAPQPVQYVMAQPAPQPVQYVMAQPGPARPPPPVVRNVSTGTVGTPEFDPDPQTQTIITQSSPVRTTVQGPYGPGGSQAVVSGVYKPPAVARTVTTDIPNHQVINTGYQQYPQQQVVYQA